MSDLVIVDTSIFLNILAVPGFDQNRNIVLEQFKRMILNGDHFFLPMATIWETGDHIAHLGGGDIRRKFAIKLIDEVEKAFRDEVPWKPTHFPEPSQFLDWLREFPITVMRQKSPKKTGEGVSLSDLSIIKEWEMLCTRHSMSRVLIWSIDGDLDSYDTGKRG